MEFFVFQVYTSIIILLCSYIGEYKIYIIFHCVIILTIILYQKSNFITIISFNITRTMDSHHGSALIGLTINSVKFHYSISE